MLVIPLWTEGKTQGGQHNNNTGNHTQKIHSSNNLEIIFLLKTNHGKYRIINIHISINSTMYLTDNPITAFRSQDISYPKVESTQVATSKFSDMIFSFKSNYSKAILYTNPKD